MSNEAAYYVTAMVVSWIMAFAFGLLVGGWASLPKPRQKPPTWITRTVTKKSYEKETPNET